MSDKRKLWEVDHPYYCSESNWFAGSDREISSSYKSWAEFVSNDYGCEDGENLLFRWDWVEGSGYDLPEYNGDDYYRNGLLKLFMIKQGKGLYHWVLVEVCRADEPAVRAWLCGTREIMREIWEPIL